VNAATPALFADRPVSAAAFDKLMAMVNRLGAVKIEEKKTCLHVVAGRAAFLGVHPRKDGLRLTLVLGRALDDPRVVKSERASANRYHHEIDFPGNAEVHEDLANWLSEAHARVTS
jgi:hypothetical protein